MPLVTAEMNIANALKKANIIPEVVDESFSPSTMLQIQYKKSGKDVVLGNELTPEETEEAPEIMFVPADENSHYTLMLVDPDAPSAQDRKFGPWRHWVLTNIPGSSGQISATAQHQQVTPYFRAAPPAGSGPHRYIFLLYKQMNGANQTFSTLNNDDRKCFDFKQYAQEHQLQLVGINFFYAEKKIN